MSHRIVSTLFTNTPLKKHPSALRHFLARERQIEDALREYDNARVLRCAKLQGDSAFVAAQAQKHGEDDWRTWGKAGQASRSRPANKGLGDAEFVYNWQPERLHHFPWQTK